MLLKLEKSWNGNKLNYKKENVYMNYRDKKTNQSNQFILDESRNFSLCFRDCEFTNSLNGEV